MKKVTPKIINMANSHFWQYIAILEKSDPSDEERALMIAYRAIALRMKQLNAAKATAASAKARQVSKAARDQKIADALDKGIPAKRIQRDPNIRGEKELSLSTISRSRKGPRT